MGVIYIKWVRGNEFSNCLIWKWGWRNSNGDFSRFYGMHFLEREVYEGGREQLLQFSRIVNEHANKIEQNGTSTLANCLVKCLGSVIVIVDTLRDTLTHSLTTPRVSHLSPPLPVRLREISEPYIILTSRASKVSGGSLA